MGGGEGWKKNAAIASFPRIQNVGGSQPSVNGVHTESKASVVLLPVGSLPMEIRSDERYTTSFLDILRVRSFHVHQLPRSTFSSSSKSSSFFFTEFYYSRLDRLVGLSINKHLKNGGRNGWNNRDETEWNLKNNIGNDSSQSKRVLDSIGNRCPD